jgi:hypothetical protein
MRKKMRALVGYHFGQHSLHMAGLEKSGVFVEHAAEVATAMKDGSVLILDTTRRPPLDQESPQLS